MTARRTALALAALAFLAAGCGAKATEPFKDAPVDSHNNTPAEILEMPDGFNNVATKCDGHGNRVYTLYHHDSSYGGVAVIPNDPSCQQGLTQ